MHLNTTFRILFAEDVSTDREIAERLLKDNGIRFVSECVETESDFRTALQSFGPNLILSDYRMPSFDGMEALKIAKEMAPDIPFIILTGSMNEDVAVDCMKAGADDYVIKQNLKRLIPAIRSAVEKKTAVSAEKMTRAKLEESESRYRALIENSSDAVYLIYNRKFEFVNSTFEKMFGYSLEEVNREHFSISLLAAPESRFILEERIQKEENGDFFPDVYEYIAMSKSGSRLMVEAQLTRFDYKDGIAIQCVIRDVTDRKRIEKKNITLSRAVEQSPESIVIADKDGDIEYVNPMFEKQTGYSFKEVCGQNPRLLQSGKHNREFYRELWESILSGKNWYGEILNRKKNGELYWVKSSISPIFSDDGKIEHFVAVNEDITERKKILKDLKEAKEKAEEANRLKSAFLQNISHEIRTPMNGILGFAGLLEEPYLDEDKKTSYINMIQKSGERMLHIINDLIDISTLETGQMKIQKEPVNINKIIQNVYNLSRKDADEKGLELSFEIPLPDKKTCVLADETRLAQVLSNLINNALKFTRKGKIHFGYRQDGKMIEFFVKDTGKGIHPDLGDSIFDRFVQEDTRIGREFEGAGLGLCISKDLVELQGGKIWYESEPGKGSTFWFNLPAEKGKEIQSEKTFALKTQDSKAYEVTLLIAEDDEISQLYLKEMLEGNGFFLMFAGNGEEAIEMVRKHPEIDLILMDIKMPKLDGLSATQAILKMKPDIPVIAQTAYAQVGDRENALKCGCVDYISKPIDPEILFPLLEKYARK